MNTQLFSNKMGTLFRYTLYILFLSDQEISLSLCFSYLEIARLTEERALFFVDGSCSEAVVHIRMVQSVADDSIFIDWWFFVIFNNCPVRSSVGKIFVSVIPVLMSR